MKTTKELTVGHTYLAVAGDLQMLLGHGRRFAMRVQITFGRQMLEPAQIAMAKQLQRCLLRVDFVERLNQPNVVLVLVRVRGDLQTKTVTVQSLSLPLPLASPFFMHSPAAAWLRCPLDRDAHASADNHRLSCDS